MGTDGRHSKVLRWGGRLAFFVVVLLVTAEISLRLTGWAVLSLRASAVEKSARPDAYRVLHLGESTTFGLGVERQEAYPAALCRLRPRWEGRPCLAFNRGVPGLTTNAMLRSLPEKLAVTRPHLVIIMAGANDFNERLNGLTPPGTESFFSSLKLYKAARLALELRHPEIKMKDGEVLYYRHGASKNILYDEPRDEVRITAVTARLEENLERMIDLCRQSEVQVVLVGYIQAIQENEVLEQVASRSGVPYVSTFVDLHQRSPELFTDDGWHPSPVGHQHIARQLAKAIGSSEPAS